MLMKKILLSLLTVLVALCMNAQTTLDFSKASTWGYEDPVSGTETPYTQINNGDVLKQGNFKITIAFTDGNGARFYNSTSNVINLRLYKPSTITISTVDGSNMSAIEINGTNLGASYVKDFTGYSNGTWKGSANSVTYEVIKSTVQINTIKIYSGSEGPKSIANTPETAYTTSEAYELIDAGEDLNTEVYVKGTITKVDEIETEKYGNAIYWISDGKKELEVYHGYGLNGAKFTSTDELQDGDDVIVCGKLKKFKDTYEIDSYSKIYSLNGKTSGGEVDPGTDPGTDPTPDTPYTVVGKGTLENPYTTEDVIKGIYKDGETVTGVWVKGTILGCFNSATKPIDETKEPVASNIALGDANGENIIPVALVASKDNVSVPRQDLNLVDHPENKGKEVWVFGDITKYFTTAGVKNTSEYSWNGTDTSIKNVNYSPLTRNAVYTTSGVKVVNTDAIQRGVYIVDGQKKYVK